MKGGEATPMRVRICLGSSCFSRGNSAVLSGLQDFLEENSLTDAVNLRGCLCADRCNAGPVFCIDDAYYDELNPERAVRILRERLVAEGILHGGTEQ